MIEEAELQALAVMRFFAEVEYADPRLVLILAYARIHENVNRLVVQHCARQTNGRRPGLFKTATSALHRAKVFESDYYAFLKLLARVRNGIAHKPTDCATLSHGSYLESLQAMHELSQSVEAIGWPVSPVEDLRRSVLAMSVAGVLAIEIESGEPKGFSALVRHMEGTANG